MTETGRYVLDKHQIRKSKAQKTEFIEYVRGYATDRGYNVTVEKGSFGSRNIVVGNPQTAKAVYTAHYDTCPRLPFPNFITPKCIWLYILYQNLITVVLLLPTFIVAFVTGFICGMLELSEETAGILGGIISYAVLILTLVLMMAGPANKHTVNDNSSGVILLLDVMERLAPEQREKIAFVFFDLEEVGLVGSSSFARAHKQTFKSKLLLNFDCVSGGEHVLFAVRRKAAPFVPLLKEVFCIATEYDGKVSAEVATKGVFYPSDQASFPCGVGVAALKKTKRGILYMSKIHTSRDTEYIEETMEYLTEGAVRLTEAL